MISDEQLAEWEDQFRGSPSVFDRRAGLAVCAEVRRLRAENERLRACMVPVIRRIETPPLTEEESKRLAREIAEGMTNCPPFLLPAGCCCGMAPSEVTLTISDGTDDGPAMVGRVAERIERELGPDNELAVEPITLSPEQVDGFASIGRAASLAAEEIAKGLRVPARLLGDAVGQAYTHAMTFPPPSGLGDAVAYGRTNPVPPEDLERAKAATYAANAQRLADWLAAHQPAADTPVVVEGPK